MTKKPTYEQLERQLAALSKKIEQVERENADLHHFKVAMAHSSDAVGISYPEGKYLYQNKAFNDLFGEIGEDPPATLFVDERLGRMIFKTVQGGGEYHGEVVMYGRDKQKLNILLRAYAIKDEAGRIIGLVGAHTDITARKKSEDALRESEERLRAILEANPDPVVVYDSKGYPQYLNPAFTEVFGWRLDELTGRQIPFVPADEKNKALKGIREIYQFGKNARMETKRYTRSGREIDVALSASSIRGANGEPVGMVVNLTDISERKAFEAHFQRVQRMESLGTLAGGIAHNFNNMMMGIQGRVSLMLMEKALDPSSVVHLKEIERYIRYAKGLTTDLLGFARGGKYEVMPTDLNKLIKYENRMVSSTKKEIHVKDVFDPLLPPVDVDRGQIRQAFMNLYLNAWQAMPDGGELSVSTQSVIVDDAYAGRHGVRPGRFARISITDTGRGMDPETCKRIFDPFFTTKKVGSGTGLGLSSAYGIIKNHGGFINVYSELGRGTTFNVYLPASGSNVPEEESTAPSRAVEYGEGLILLVDDEKIIREVGQQMLERLGYSVLVAENGKDALEVYRETKDRIDIVILDMIMPGMSGAETFERLIILDPNVKVLLASGYSANGEAKDILARGCKDFIQKPFSLDLLSVKIREILTDH